MSGPDNSRVVAVTGASGVVAAALSRVVVMPPAPAGGWPGGGGAPGRGRVSGRTPPARASLLPT